MLLFADSAQSPVLYNIVYTFYFYCEAGARSVLLIIHHFAYSWRIRRELAISDSKFHTLKANSCWYDVMFEYVHFEYINSHFNSTIWKNYRSWDNILIFLLVSEMKEISLVFVTLSYSYWSILLLIFLHKSLFNTKIFPNRSISNQIKVFKI